MSGVETRAAVAVSDTIMEAIRACQTEAEIDGVAKKYLSAMKQLKTTQAGKLEIIHIRNLAALRRKMIRDGEDLSERRDATRTCSVCGHWIAPFLITRFKKTTRYCQECRPKNGKGDTCRL